MLRDFQYKPEINQLIDIIQRFKLDESTYNAPIYVLKFEVLSPDSFAWKLLLGTTVYYLYAEDYIPGIDHVKSVLDKYIGSSTWKFMKPKKLVSFESATPVITATIYQKPERADDLMSYAVDSGYDFVFLAKTLESSEDAHFPGLKRS